MRRLKSPRPGEEPALIPRRWRMLVITLLFLGMAAVVVTLMWTGRADPSARRALPRLGGAGRALMAEAETMEAEGLWGAAARAYAALAEDVSAAPALRSSAAERLANLRFARLKDTPGALEALELAYFLAREPERRARLKDLRQTIQAPSPPAGSPGASPVSVPLFRVGDETVTLEEVLYAYRTVHPEAPLTVEGLHRFSLDYMDQVALAAEARRRGLHGDTMHRLEMNFYERQLLAQALLSSLVPELDEPTLQAYYEAHPKEFLQPAAARVDHIVVASPEAADEVNQGLARGEDFNALARRLSLDRDLLPDGSSLGWINADDGGVPRVGPLAGLAARLTQYDDGATTGPIAASRGYHWFRVRQRRPERPRPLEEARSEIENRLRQEQFLLAQRDLLKRLKTTLGVEMLTTDLEARLRERGASAAASAPGETSPEPESPGAAPR